MPPIHKYSSVSSMGSGYGGVCQGYHITQSAAVCMQLSTEVDEFHLTGLKDRRQWWLRVNLPIGG